MFIYRYKFGPFLGLYPLLLMWLLIITLGVVTALSKQEEVVLQPLTLLIIFFWFCEVYQGNALVCLVRAWCRY